jgi:hypothetical protein
MQLHALPSQGQPAGILTLQHIVGPPKHSFEILVEASTILQLLHYVCLKNQHHVDDAKICHHLSQ